MTRREWGAAVRRWQAPRDLRPVKATLLSLEMCMTTTGSIERKQDGLLAVTGLPRRTLERHLAKAITVGWLTVSRTPHRGSWISRYDMALPAVDGGKCHGDYPPSTTASPRLDLPPSDGGLIRDSASGSEHHALEQNRERRHDHDEHRARTTSTPEPREVSNEENTRATQRNLSLIHGGQRQRDRQLPLLVAVRDVPAGKRDTDGELVGNQLGITDRDLGADLQVLRWYGTDCPVTVGGGGVNPVPAVLASDSRAESAAGPR